MKTGILNKSMLVIAGLLGFASVSQASIHVVANAKVKPAVVESFKQAADVIVAGTHTEAGNISFDYFQSAEDPTEFVFIEEWKSQEALDQHFQTPHMQTFFQQVGTYFEPGYPVIKKYLPIVR